MVSWNFSSIGPDQIRSDLPQLLASNLTDPATQAACRVQLGELVGAWSDEAAASVCHDIAVAGQEGRFYPANPYCRQISRAWARLVLTSLDCSGFEHLESASRQGPTVILSNHASYIDSPILDALFAAHNPSLANRVVHIAGGKVYQAIFRRIAIVCLDSIPVQQSESVRNNQGGGGGASVSRRELARNVAMTIKAAEEVLRQAKILLLYPEGSRTRDGRLRPFLPGTFRYLRCEGTRIIPAALEGTGQMMGIAGDEVTPSSCKLTLGEPIEVAAEGGPRRALTRAEEAIKALLPPHLRPLS